jgi:chorismate synthase
MSNTFGKIFRLTSFGESHGVAVGGVIDGCPAGIIVDNDFIQNELNRRRPGQSSISTPRKELDKVEFLSGIFDGKTTGQPIGFLVKNEQQRSVDYEHLKTLYRPSHADYTYQQKYGIRDYRGGGRSSARETIARVVAGAIAKLVLKQKGIEIFAYTSQIGNISLPNRALDLSLEKIESNIVRCPDLVVAQQMIELVEFVRAEGDSIGGIVSCSIKNMPIGIGEPVFDKLSARLAYAMLSINAAKGFEYGLGFGGVDQKGSEQNDSFILNEHQKVQTRTNNSGGIQGGLSNGEDVYFRVAFKPTATISKKQTTVTSNGEMVELKAYGRHDPCVVPRAVPIVEAMAAITVLDLILIAQKDSL